MAQAAPDWAREPLYTKEMKRLVVAAAAWWAGLGLAAASWEAPPSAFFDDREIRQFLLARPVE